MAVVQNCAGRCFQACLRRTCASCESLRRPPFEQLTASLFPLRDKPLGGVRGNARDPEASSRPARPDGGAAEKASAEALSANNFMGSDLL